MTKYDSSGKFIGRKPAADDGRRLTPDMIPERHKRTLAGLVGEPDACWLMRNPYHQMNLSWNGGRAINAGAHKVAAALAFGEVPEGMVVRHTCDEPRCTNPKHLVVCTQGDNLADMVAKGRQRRLSPEQRAELVRAHKEASLAGKLKGRGRKFTPEQRAEWSARTRALKAAGHYLAANAANCRPVMNPEGRTWRSVGDAAQAEGVSDSAITNRIRRGRSGWALVDVESYLESVEAGP